MPAPGIIKHLKWPDENENCRIDSGIEIGDVVSPHYDPMIAKVIGCGETREIAIVALIKALNEIEIIGVGQNLGFILHLLNAKPFVDGIVDTSYVDSLNVENFVFPEEMKHQALAIAAKNIIAGEYVDIKCALPLKDPYSPWGECDGWRLGENQNISVRLALGGNIIQVNEYASDDELFYEIDGFKVVIDKNIDHKIVINGSDIVIFGLGHPVSIKAFDPLDIEGSIAFQGNPFAAPMPGKIIAINITAGDLVEAGDVLIVLEAMKMEHSIRAPSDGIIVAVHENFGNQVDEGTVLLNMKI
jgi:3-methylcrotonyl-CoA carboxylase alpha subunit